MESPVTIVKGPHDPRDVQKIILPGVGALANAMDNLIKTGVFFQIALCLFHSLLFSVKGMNLFDKRKCK